LQRYEGLLKKLKAWICLRNEKQGRKNSTRINRIDLLTMKLEAGSLKLAACSLFQSELCDIHVTFLWVLF